MFGNLGGVTGRLLALDGGRLAGRARLDVIIPVGGFKRCADYENGYGVSAKACACRMTSMLLRAPWHVRKMIGATFTRLSPMEGTARCHYALSLDGARLRTVCF